MSPSRPQTAADTAPTSRNAVITQLTSAALASKAAIRRGIAISIIDASSEPTMSATMRTPTIIQTGRAGSDATTACGDVIVGLTSHR
jgi:hypothetical protein